MSGAPSVSVSVAVAGAHLASAGELVAAKRFGEAEGEILRALSASPADAKALTLLALVRYKLGRLEDAHATYREIAGAAPNDAGARRNLGLLALKLERIDDALPELEMAVRIAPGDGRAWSYLGYAYAKKGEVVQAAAAFRRAGQDALANELDQAAKVQRPPTPVSRGSLGRPVALAPPLPPMTPPMPPSVAAEKRPSSWKEPSARRPEDPAPPRVEAAAHSVRPADVERSVERSVEPSVDSPLPREVEAVPLLSFVLARLGQAPSPSIPSGAFRLAIADEAHARADAILAGTGTLKWEPGFRRAQGRASTEPMGREGGAPFYRLTGGGEIWIAAAANGWRPTSCTCVRIASWRSRARLPGKQARYRTRSSACCSFAAEARWRSSCRGTPSPSRSLTRSRRCCRGRGSMVGSGAWCPTARECRGRPRSISAVRARAWSCSKRLRDSAWRPSGAS